MVKTIVVPLDGSTRSESALGPARWLAANLDADVHLVITTLDPDLARDEQYLATKRDDLGLDRVSTFVLPLIFPAPGIVEHTNGAPEPILCMATHGHSGLGAVILGSVAELVVRDATCPVVLVGPACAALPLEPGPLVWCWDGSAVSQSAVPLAASLASALGIAARIVNVRTPESLDYGLAVAPERQQQLDDFVHDFEAAGVTATADVLDRVDPAGAVLEAALDAGASLIVTATHGHGGLVEGAMGRVAAKIVHHAHCPVVVRRPAPDEG